MRHLLLFVFSFLSYVSAMSQQVFQYELECCQRTIQNPMTGFFAVRVATFQKDALLYLQKHASQADSTSCRQEWLDHQAYNLADFLSLYQLILTDERLTLAEHERIKRIFRDISLKHPAFYDEDELTTLQYISTSESSLTPFSLDTDWRMAYPAVVKSVEQESFTPQVKSFLNQRH